MYHITHNAILIITIYTGSWLVYKQKGNAYGKKKKYYAYV